MAEIYIKTETKTEYTELKLIKRDGQEVIELSEPVNLEGICRTYKNLKKETQENRSTRIKAYFLFLKMLYHRAQDQARDLGADIVTINFSDTDPQEALQSRQEGKETFPPQETAEINFWQELVAA